MLLPIALVNGAGGLVIRDRWQQLSGRRERHKGGKALGKEVIAATAALQSIVQSVQALLIAPLRARLCLALSSMTSDGRVGRMDECRRQRYFVPSNVGPACGSSGLLHPIGCPTYSLNRFRASSRGGNSYNRGRVPPPDGLVSSRAGKMALSCWPSCVGLILWLG